KSAAAYHLFYPTFVEIDTNYQDVLALFYRHPYALVLMMACWGLHREPLASKRTLKELAKCKPCDLDIAGQLEETFNRPVPVSCRYALSDIVDYATEQSRLPREDIQRFLEQGLSEGLYADMRDGVVFLDRQHTINWLQNNTLFREADL